MPAPPLSNAPASIDRKYDRQSPDNLPPDSEAEERPRSEHSNGNTDPFGIFLLPPAGANCGWWLQQHGYPQGLPYRPRPAVLPFPVKHEVTVPETPMAILQSHPERSSRHEPSQTVPLFLLSVRR